MALPVKLFCNQYQWRPNFLWLSRLCKKQSWVEFCLHLAWTWLHELPVCLPCMNYDRWAILTLNGDLPILMFPVLFMGNERRFRLRSLRVVSQYWPHRYTPCLIACNTSRARNFICLFILYFASSRLMGGQCRRIHPLIVIPRVDW